ncbi:hypothetical protein [Streptomyces sp. H27-S2]|uniref:hypothetical protein n=1 Tax=Streptomyces antarcticus TaxID=2996458 RepID=UPI00226FE0D9|nr:hypothetical protein [Streptomyces sp. H27-S2]MCY0949485.1 hypothetical protein [Streptomyces sp. H27-S2]
MGTGTPDSLLSRGRRTGWWTGLVIVVAAVVEMAVIVGQVIRGRRSHFDNETPLDEALFSVMGTTVVVLWLGTLVLAVALWRRPLVDRSATWAIRLGSVIGLGGLALGFLMTSPTDAQLARQITDTVGAHSVGVPDGGPHLPVTGWSATGGDLRIAHFVGMHALQPLPLLALALAFAAGRYGWALGDNARVRLILVSGAGYAGLVALTAWQALRGQALTSPDALTLGAAAALAVVVAAGVLLVLRTGRGAPAEAVPEGARAPGR